MTGQRSYGVSTLLYHGSRLSRTHLLEIAASGFDAVEIRATRTHFDYHSQAAVADLQEWLADAGLALASVHAPLSEHVIGGRDRAPLLLASADQDIRARALIETKRALHIARRIPFQVLVAHIGIPRAAPAPASLSTRDAARRSIEDLQAVAAPLGVRVAVEVIQNELSRVSSLVHFLDDVLDTTDVGLCLDFGHAHLDGDLIEAIETVSEHVIAVDVHDNHGRNDDHLVPFDGTIDWPGALTAIQKVGYDGTLMLEANGRGPSTETLARAQRARQKMDRLFAH